jgi:prepilin peptidase CpaA
MPLLTEPRVLALLALVLAAAAWDWRSRRIPNALTIGGGLAGIVLAGLGAGAGPSFLAALTGCAVAFALLLPLYALHVTGAGDVKLMAAIGAFLGPFDAAWSVLFTFIAGGLLALAWVAWQRALPHLAANLRSAVLASMSGQSPAALFVSVGRLPYALAICVGTLACLVLRQPFSH